MKKCNCTSSERALSFYKEIRSNINNFIPVSLCVVGELMVDTNAETMDSVVDFKSKGTGKKYKIAAKYILTDLAR